MENTHTIYGLIDPRDARIRYVGVTTKQVNERLSQHIYSAKNKSSNYCYRNNWLRYLINNNMKPIPCILELCNSDNWEEKEKHWIKMFPDLTNFKEGGNSVITKEQRSKLSIQRSAEAHKKPIYQLDRLGKIIKKWDSASDAVKELKLAKSAISNVLSKRVVTAGGFRWAYVEGFNKKVLRKNRSTVKCSVYMKDGSRKIKTFFSIAECCRILNIPHTTIYMSFRRKGFYENDDYYITKI